MRYTENIEKNLLHGLVAELRELHDAEATILNRAGSQSDQLDGLIELVLRGRHIQLAVEVKNEAFPRDVKNLLWQVRNYLVHENPGQGETIPFIAARSISRGARKLLQAENVGFYDSGGSLFIPSRDLYLLIDRPAPKRKRRVFSLFEGQKARTIITLFAHRDEWIGVKELAEFAEVSPATASETLSELEKRDWVEAEGSGPAKVRKLTGATNLLDEWANYATEQRQPRLTRYYVPSSDSEEICRKLDFACRTQDMVYAITGEVAAQQYTPYLSSISQVRCRMGEGLQRERVLGQMNAREVNEGWNFAILETRSYKDVIVGDEDEGIFLAPPLQVYIDLLRGSGRSKDLAAHLREVKLRA
ncbi:MAG: hypothetical protein JHC92_09530 [Sphingomonadaceae bacterium]|nr:hypothetical protein [Sphingomonadaceae bacterium]